MCALALSLLCVASVAHADDPSAVFTCAVVKRQTSCVYRYFDYPTALYADGNGFLVADGGKGIRFTPEGEEKTAQVAELPDNVRVVFPYNAEENDYFVLVGGALLRTRGGEQTEPDAGRTYADFVLQSGVLYGASGNSLYRYAPHGEDEAGAAPQAIYTHIAPVHKVAADDDGIYFTAANEYNRYQSDIWYLPNASTAARRVYEGSEEILSLEGRKNGVITLTRGNITAYAPTADGAALAVEKRISDVNAVAISAHNDVVYAVGQEKSVFRIDADFTARTYILASASDGIGFYRANAGLASRKQMIAVADERNDRVQILREDGVSVLAVSRPKAVAIDYERNLYVAHDSTLSTFDAALQAVRSFSAPGGVTITDLQIDSRNDLYALGGNGQVYRIRAGTQTFEALLTTDEVRAVAFSVSLHDDSLFVATDAQTVLCLQEGTTVDTIDTASDVTDICVDLDNSVYALTATGNIIKYANGNGTVYAPADAGSRFVNATKIILNTVDFGESALLTGGISLSYGDLLVSDTGAHAVKVIARDLLDVNESFDVQAPAPDISDVEIPADDSRILYPLSACDVYAQPAEISLVTSLREGMKVIIPRYDASLPFQLIVADNMAGETEKPIVGYVRNAFIGEALPYDAPPAAGCYSYLSNVTVYRYPSFNSPVLAVVAQTNTPFALLPFVHTDSTYGYVDNFAKPGTWYRVRFDEGGESKEGYVLCDKISFRGENPDDRNIYPRTNAEIIKEATLYEKVDGKMVAVQDDVFPALQVGRKVEVVGAFDSSEKYTRIRYYHEGLGTQEFYVRTETLKYHGVNKVAIVAIVLIVLTVVLGIVLLVRFLYVKRNRRLNGTK